MNKPANDWHTSTVPQHHKHQIVSMDWSICHLCRPWRLDSLPMSDSRIHNASLDRYAPTDIANLGSIPVVVEFVRIQFSDRQYALASMHKHDRGSLLCNGR